MRKKLIITGVIAAMLLAVTGVIALTFKSFLFDERIAESELTEYLAAMYPDKTVLGKDCVGRDTDGDGYASCSARVKGPNDTAEQLLALECAVQVFSSGCKPRAEILKMTR